mmetsp:Transcript_29140/g.89088  ORF Transcript_29140/g.89088 Transcript_29140/m.89088 type:complete len:290 (+) Transcript_29140:267-1136(+)
MLLWTRSSCHASTSWTVRMPSWLRSMSAMMESTKESRRSSRRDWSLPLRMALTAWRSSSASMTPSLSWSMMWSLSPRRASTRLMSASRDVAMRAILRRRALSLVPWPPSSRTLALMSSRSVRSRSRADRWDMASSISATCSLRLMVSNSSSGSSPSQDGGGSASSGSGGDDGNEGSSVAAAGGAATSGGNFFFWLVVDDSRGGVVVGRGRHHRCLGVLFSFLGDEAVLGGEEGEFSGAHVGGFVSAAGIGGFDDGLVEDVGVEAGDGVRQRTLLVPELGVQGEGAGHDE